mmetsp:Transcript_2262/g.6501  ORF Transcript_2262/g.6501 Transcript_2262/m.6501 type:complete len:466 (-) Transcript_2262:812-2209(-)
MSAAAPLPDALAALVVKALDEASLLLVVGVLHGEVGLDLGLHGAHLGRVPQVPPRPKRRLGPRRGDGRQRRVELVDERDGVRHVDERDLLLGHPLDLHHQPAQHILRRHDQHRRDLVLAPARLRVGERRVHRRTHALAQLAVQKGPQPLLAVLERLGARGEVAAAVEVVPPVDRLDQSRVAPGRRPVAEAAPPALHLLQPVRLDAIGLDSALQLAVVSLVEPPRVLHRRPLQVHLVEGEPRRLDGPLEKGRVHHGDPLDAGHLEHLARQPRLLAASVGEVGVGPARENLVVVEGALPVPQQHERAPHPLLLARDLEEPRREAKLLEVGARLLLEPLGLLEEVCRRRLPHRVPLALDHREPLPRLGRGEGGLDLAVLGGRSHHRVRDVLQHLLPHRLLRRPHARLVHQEAAVPRRPLPLAPHAVLPRVAQPRHGRLRARAVRVKLVQQRRRRRQVDVVHVLGREAV